MPSLADLQFLSGSNVLIGLVITAALVVLIADWRLAIFALAFQYVLLGLLLTTLISTPASVVRIISGALAATILYLTMRHRAIKETAEMNQNKEESGVVIPVDRVPIFIVAWPFRFFAVALVAVAIIGFASSMRFLGLPAYVLFSSLWLMAIGVLISMLSRDALRLGFGILVFTGGFSILDTAIEGSLFLYGLLNIADLLIALVVAHLASLSHEGAASRRRGDLSS